MVTQTEVQEENAIRFGAGLLEYENDSLAWVDCGWVEDATHGDRWSKVTLKGANVGTIKTRIKDHEMFIEGSFGEINLTNLQQVRGGIDTVTPVAGTQATVTDEPHTLTGTVGVRLDHRMGTGAEVGTIVVTDASNNAAVRNVDYIIYQDGAGYTCIARVSGSTVITTGEGVKVDYVYTPNAGKILKSGGRTEIAFRRWRLTNVNEDGKVYQVTMKKGTVDGGLKIDLKPDDSGENWMCPFAITGVVDGTLPVGEQLFEILDEQSP